MHVLQIWKDLCFWLISHTFTVRGVFESQIPCIWYITHTLTVKGTLKIQGRTNSCFKNIDSNIIHACITHINRSMLLANYSYVYRKRCFWRPNPMHLIQGRTNTCFSKIDSNIVHACITNMCGAKTWWITYTLSISLKKTKY